jgi:hypothetical protein
MQSTRRELVITNEESEQANEQDGEEFSTQSISFVNHIRFFQILEALMNRLVANSKQTSQLSSATLAKMTAGLPPSRSMSASEKASFSKS